MVLSFLAAMALLLAAACTSGERSETTTDQVPSSSTSLDRSALKPTVRLAVSDWTAARLNTAIAEQLIERRLGYPVERVPVLDVEAMLADMAIGEVDAVLEIWPSTLLEGERNYVDSGTVETLGELGVVGKIGWYVPRYVVDENPELATWQSYADRSVAAEFATTETADRGRFLGTDPGYAQFDQQIIDALDLPFDIVYSGSEAATMAEVEKAAASNSPVLLYWWTPTAAVARFDLVNVTLPPRTAACEDDIAAGQGQGCDYPEDRLLKLASPSLVERAPDVHRFLGALSLTTTDQLLMIDQVDNRGLDVDAVAATWIENNQDRWESWLS